MSTKPASSAPLSAAAQVGNLPKQALQDAPSALLEGVLGATSEGITVADARLPDQPIINALAENVVETERGTVLEENGARISTIEHVLA